MLDDDDDEGGYGLVVVDVHFKIEARSVEFQPELPLDWWQMVFTPAVELGVYAIYHMT